MMQSQLLPNGGSVIGGDSGYDNFGDANNSGYHPSSGYPTNVSPNPHFSTVPMTASGGGGGGGMDGGAGAALISATRSLLSSILQSIRSELNDMYGTMIAAGHSGGYFNSPAHSSTSAAAPPVAAEGVGRTFGRVLAILFLDGWLMQLFVPFSVITTLALIPLSTIHGADKPLLHPIVTLLFGAFVFIIGRAAMIQGIAELYAGGSPTWLDIAKNKLKMHLFPLFLLTFAVGLSGWMLYYIVNRTIGTDWIDHAIDYFPNERVFWTSLVVDSVLLCGLTYLLAFLIIVVPVIVVEHVESPIVAIQRAMTLAAGHHSYMMKCYVLLIIGYFLVDLVVELVSGHFFAVGRLKVVDAFFWFLPTAGFVPMLALVEAVLYINLRTHKESLTMDSLQQELRQNALLSSSASVAASGVGNVIRGRHHNQYNPVSMTDNTMNNGINFAGHHRESQDYEDTNNNNIGEISFDYRAPMTSQQQHQQSFI